MYINFVDKMDFAISMKRYNSVTAKISHLACPKAAKYVVTSMRLGRLVTFVVIQIILLA